MTPAVKFSENLAKVHGLHGAPMSEFDTTESNDIRHAELMAMVDAFLGADYDPEKISEVERLGDLMDDAIARLANDLESNHISPRDYLTKFHETSLRSFKEIESVLGAEDFLKLYGVPPEGVETLIDEDAFLDQTSSKSAPADEPRRSSFRGSFHKVAAASPHDQEEIDSWPALARSLFQNAQPSPLTRKQLYDDFAPDTLDEILCQTPIVIDAADKTVIELMDLVLDIRRHIPPLRKIILMASSWVTGQKIKILFINTEELAPIGYFGQRHHYTKENFRFGATDDSILMLRGVLASRLGPLSAGVVRFDFVPGPNHGLTNFVELGPDAHEILGQMDVFVHASPDKNS